MSSGATAALIGSHATPNAMLVVPWRGGESVGTATSSPSTCLKPHAQNSRTSPLPHNPSAAPGGARLRGARRWHAWGGSGHRVAHTGDVLRGPPRPARSDPGGSREDTRPAAVAGRES